jgi:phosphoglucomutase
LGTLPEKGVVFNTIVTSTLGAKIAKAYGFDVISTLTGFKFIGEQARFLEGTDRRFIFGYEESFGYVINDAVRDKDALQAMLLVSEAANYYFVTEHKTLYDKLMDIYHRYGYHSERLDNIDLVGLEGKKRINRIMDHFHKVQLKIVAGLDVIWKADYITGIQTTSTANIPIDLPSSDVVKFALADGSWFVLRPSGTEPKLKLYVAGEADSLSASQAKTDAILKAIKTLVDEID